MGEDELKKNSWKLKQSNTKMSLLTQKNVNKTEEVYFQTEMTFTPCLLGNILPFQWHTLVGKQPLKFWADLHSLQENLSKQLQPPFSRWELIIAFVLQALPFAPTKWGKSCFSQTTGAHRSLTAPVVWAAGWGWAGQGEHGTNLCLSPPSCWPLQITALSLAGTQRYRPALTPYLPLVNPFSAGEPTGDAFGARNVSRRLVFGTVGAAWCMAEVPPWA